MFCSSEAAFKEGTFLLFDLVEDVFNMAFPGGFMCGVGWCYCDIVICWWVQDGERIGFLRQCIDWYG